MMRSAILLFLAGVLLASVTARATGATRAARHRPPAPRAHTAPGPRATVRPPRFVQSVTWLPDSLHVLAAGFDSTAFRIYRVNLDGSGYAPISDGPDMWPTPSRDGSHIIFQSNRGGRPRLYVMKSDGTRAEALPHQPRHPRTPAWSPDGSVIALSSKTDSLQRLCLVRPDGTGLHALGSGPGNDWNPAWSPDGARLVFFTTVRGADSVWTVNADGSGRRAVAAGFYPSWTSDGARVVYARADTVFTRAPDGGAEEVLQPGSFYARYNPGDGRLAYIAGKWPASALWVRDRPGGTPRQLMP